MKRKITRPTLPKIKIRTILKRSFFLLLGTFIAAFGYAIFQVPFNLAAGGVGGIGLIINYYTGWQVGTIYFVFNIPLMILGFRTLGRWQFVARTLVAVTFYSAFTNLFIEYAPLVIKPYPLTEDLLLSAVYGGLLGGIGGGLVYLSGSTLGGTSITGRMIQKKTGQPLSQVYIYTDGIILLGMGAVFGWQVTLYGLLMLLIGGMASDYTMEGPSSTRTATIITNRPDEMIAALLITLDRGVSYWPITGGYTGETRTMINCTMSRPQVSEVKRVVSEVDADAFVTIGVSHQAMGKGFIPLRTGRDGSMQN